MPARWSNAQIIACDVKQKLMFVELAKTRQNTKHQIQRAPAYLPVKSANTQTYSTGYTLAKRLREHF
jgi:hypothetical protein